MNSEITVIRSCYHADTLCYESEFMGPLKRDVCINIQSIYALDAAKKFKEQPWWPSSFQTYLLETIGVFFRRLGRIKVSYTPSKGFE